MMKLAIAQMVLGALIAFEFTHLVLRGIPWFLWYLHYYQFYIVIGLLVLGCGVAQFLKARKVSIKHEATP